MASLLKHLNKRLAWEVSPEEEAGMGRGGSSGQAAGPQRRQPLSKETQRKLAQIILRMADKAQYSKVGLTCL